MHGPHVVTVSTCAIGSGVQIFGNRSSSATYDLRLDGQTNSSISTFSALDPTLLASYDDLDNEDHTLTLIVRNPSNLSSTLIAIDRVAISVPLGSPKYVRAPCLDEIRSPPKSASDDVRTARLSLMLLQQTPIFRLSANGRSNKTPSHRMTLPFTRPQIKEIKRSSILVVRLPVPCKSNAPNVETLSRPDVFHSRSLHLLQALPSLYPGFVI